METSTSVSAFCISSVINKSPALGWGAEKFYQSTHFTNLLFAGYS